MLIERAGPEDLEPLAQLMASSALLQRYGHTLAEVRKDLASGSDIRLVARDSEGLAGLARVMDMRGAMGFGAYLKLLLVKDGWQSRGVGQALLETAEMEARGAGAKTLYLFATSDNHGARRFYERQGYRYVGELVGFVRPELNEALYYKRLL